mmetsp:Transcript_33473/g.85607  ORF Transcript_33473/g.85607 Transcript_33473/m.85607 type:complete len:220 (+) Transcript_33473:535-1194(+)
MCPKRQVFLPNPCRAPCANSGLAELIARIIRAAPELLLDAQELVVLGHALRAAWRASLDLACLQAHDEVGNEGVLSLATAVGDHHTPALRRAVHAGGNGLRDGADLVHLQQQRVHGLLLFAVGDALRVRHQEIITNDLHCVAHLLHHLCVRVPMVLVEGVLDGHDGVLRRDRLVELHHLVLGLDERGVRVVHLEAEIVGLVLRDIELRGGNVHRELHLA